MTYYRCGDLIGVEDNPCAMCEVVVVIDPEDREAVERLASLYERDDNPGSATEYMQDALREFANPTPPRPDEPLGLGAVVESARRNRYVRAGDGWLPETVLGQFRNPIDWADIAAVRVLSPGYTEDGA